MADFHTTVLDNQIKALPTTDTASGAIATFDTDMTENLIEVVCDIQYHQASGTPSPSDPLPITVYTSLNLSHSGADTSTPNVTNIPFGQTVAKGTLNVTTGKLEIEWIGEQFTTTEYSGSSGSASNFARLTSGAKKVLNNTVGNVKASYLKPDTANNVVNVEDNLIGINTNGQINIKIVGMNSKSDYDTYLSNNPLTIVYELDSHITIQLSATQITALLNENNIWCDTNGDTSVKYILSVGKKIS